MAAEHWLAAALWAPACAAPAAVIRVGPAEPVATIAAAARLAQDGDTVEIMPGDYRGDVAVWLQKRLTIQGIGARPVLHADGRGAEGKAIWVIRDGDFTLRNIEFRGARVAGGNGAGIRFERGRLHVVDCRFADNQMGLLTGNDPASELRIESSVFGPAPRQQAPLPHLLYVGAIGSVTISGSRFFGGHWGHLVKSRARRSDLRYNMIVDGEGGEASYETDFPNGGEVTLVGNIIGKSTAPQNSALVAWGAEGFRWSDNRLTMVHNTLVADGPAPVTFVRVFDAGAPWPVVTRNNLASGNGTFEGGVPGDHAGNQQLPPSLFADAPGHGYALPADLAWRRRLAAVPLAGTDGGAAPTHQFAAPAGVRPLALRDEAALVGAVQSPPVGGR